MKKIKIVGGIILALVFLIAGLGFYKFNFTDDDIYFSGENIYPENYKIFQGSWVCENSEFEEGFTLNEDNTASSINMASLLYKAWKIEDSTLVLTTISLGNQTGSVFDEKYVIKSFNHKRIFLNKEGSEYIYKKINNSEISNNTLLSPSFMYFPANVDNEAQTQSLKHPIDFTSNPRASQFNTLISERYDNGTINFGGYYIIIWGKCSSGCIKGVLIDTRDGKVYDLPTTEGSVDFGNGIENYRYSVLLSTSRTSPDIPGTTNREVEITYWLWNESAKEFVHYMTSNKSIKE